jgi:hypothetical protein
VPRVSPRAVSKRQILFAMAVAPVTCPRCEMGGLVHWARVKANGRLFLVCTSCEAVWDQQDDVGARDPQEFSYFLESQGLPDDWWEVKVLLRLTR